MCVLSSSSSMRVSIGVVCLAPTQNNTHDNDYHNQQQKSAEYHLRKFTLTKAPFLAAEVDRATMLLVQGSDIIILRSIVHRNISRRCW